MSNQSTVKVYHGMGNDKTLIVYGHVFSLSPLPRRKYRQNFWTNAFALIRSFMIVGICNAKVRLSWKEKYYYSTTADDGFFRFEIEVDNFLLPGLYNLTIDYVKTEASQVGILATGNGSLIVPANNRFAFISDIDDTFLISHSSSFFKKLYVLLTKNAHSRKPFEGVVKHYQMLASNGENYIQNAFFYVSSSEWNLYEFIKEFCRKNKMPEGVFLLNQAKKLKHLLKTGSNNHSGKFMRIARIIEAYPEEKFILLGDDSQQDPVIYASIIDHFKNRIAAVYLRHVYKKNLSDVTTLIQQMEGNGVSVCHFVHSKDAIQHSIQLGLISAEVTYNNKRMEDHN